MASEWSPAAGWRSYDEWKRWYRQNWGGLQASPPPGEWRAVYRAFSEPEGIQAEVEIAVGHEATRPRVRFNPEIPWDTVPPGSPCPRHSRGCSAWHPDHTPQRGVFADDLAELVPVGELVPMESKTFGGRKVVLIVFAGQEGLIECTSPTAGALIARARQEAANPGSRLSLTPAQQLTASELPWYRQWLLEHGYTEDDLIPFAIP